MRIKFSAFRQDRRKHVGLIHAGAQSEGLFCVCGGVTGVVETAMHKMSFDIGKQQAGSDKKSGPWSAIFLIATVVILAWWLEPVLKAILSS
jgi:hypothetical protein